MLTRRTIYPAAKIAPARSSIEMQIADYLVSFWPALPEKHIEMNASGQKYSWAKDEADHHIPLTYTDLLAHARGTKTIGAHLHNSAGLCRIGMLDIDQGGRTAILAALAAAHKLGYTAYGLYVPPRNRAGAEHDGGRLVVPFAEFTDKRAIIAVMEQIRDAAGLPAATEIWPGGGNAVALPFAYHVRKGKRGTLLDQAGELLDLDQPAELGRAVELVTSLRPNAAPTPAAQASDKEHYAQSGHVQTPAETPHQCGVVRAQPRHAPSAGRLDTLAIFAEARAQFNAAHTWPELLGAFGGSATRDGWACACGWKHGNTTQIAITSQDKIVSFTPHCSWAPLKGSGRALDKFGFWCDRAHGGNYRAAAEAAARQYGLWVEPPQAQRAPVDTHYRAPAQDAQRKRAQRLAARQERIARIDPLIDRLDQDSQIYSFARDVFAYHLACWMDGPEHYASIERITRDVLGLDRAPNENEARRVQLAHQRLIECHYLKRTIRSSRTTKDTNCWQPGTPDGHRVIPSATAQPEAENEGRITLIESHTDPMFESVGACEPRAEETACENVYADTLEAWAWSEVEHGADELSLLERAPAPEPPALVEPAPLKVDPELRIYVHALAVDAGQPRDYTSASTVELLSEADRLAGLLDQAAEPLAPAAVIVVADHHSAPPAAPSAPEQRKQRRKARAIAEPGGASYTPSDDFTVGARRKAGPIARRVHAARQRQARADRYIVELARMKAKELKGEKKKYQCIIAKFEGQHWLEKPDGPCDRLRLIELEIDARACSTRPNARPSQAHTGPIVQQAVLYGL